MKKRFLNVLILIALIATSCTPGTGIIPAAPTATQLAPPTVRITKTPDAESAVRGFLTAWQADDYAAMYAMLSAVSRDTIDEETFTLRYRNTAANLSLKNLEFEILSSLTNPHTAEVSFRMSYVTNLIGTLQRDMLMRLNLEDGNWRVQWEDALIMPELKGGNRLAMDYKIPARGDIFDIEGDPLVTKGTTVALGIVPGRINPETEETLLFELSQLTGLTTENIFNRYAFAQPDWYIPVGQTTGERFNRRASVITNLGGLVWDEYETRLYHEERTASHILGYMLSISAEQLEEYRRLGYRGDERVGAAGIERWGEPYLSGQHGGTLYVLDPNGQIVTILASSDPQPAESIYLTIDKDFQEDVEFAMQGFLGAAVVIEQDTGRVLAMASSPGFDPNLFDPNNPNNALLNDIFNDFKRPLFNRAAQGAYPLGSVFKIVTMAAALESTQFTSNSTYDCQYEFTELLDRTLYDWTWERCQNEVNESLGTEDPITIDDCKTKPSGILTLPEGLMRSCNPWFWHIGLQFFKDGSTTLVAEMSRDFGLGSRTGIAHVAESAGVIIDPTDGVQATNQAVGQGENLVTPLQVAVFTAAVGNGGTIYRPQLVEKIQPIEGEPTMVFKPEARSVLPVSAENMASIRQAMWDVVHLPRGTASLRLRGLTIPTAGKTGTAQSGQADPHSWYAGYTLARENTGLPDIAVVVIVENIGDGSEYAVPIFRRIVESYYFGGPRSLYWWESSIGVVRPPATETPQP